MKLFLTTEDGRQEYLALTRDMPAHSLLLFAIIIALYYATHQFKDSALQFLLWIGAAIISVVFVYCVMASLFLLGKIKDYHQQNNALHTLGYWLESTFIVITLVAMYGIVIFESYNFTLAFLHK